MRGLLSVFSVALTLAAATGCHAGRGASTLGDDTMAVGGTRALAQLRGTTATSSGPVLPSDFEQGLSDAWACGDLLLHVANPDRSVMLTLYWPRLLDQTPAGADEGWQAELGGTEGHDVAIVVHTGAHLDAGTCARDGDEPAMIDQTWTAVAEVGRLGLDSADGRSRLSAWLWDVELRREGDGARVVMERLEQRHIELDD